MKKGIILVCAALILLVTAGFILYPAIEFANAKDMQTALNIDFSKADVVYFSYGEPPERCSIMGKKELQGFFDVFKGVKLKLVSVDCGEFSAPPNVMIYQSNHLLGQFIFRNATVILIKENEEIVYKSSKCISDSQIKKMAEKYSTGFAHS